jgi:hypothetical protein
MPLYQQDQQLKRARSERHRDQNAIFVGSEQAAGPAVEAKAFEQENLVGGKFVHAPSSPTVAAISPNADSTPFKKNSEGLIAVSLRIPHHGRC